MAEHMNEYITHKQLIIKKAIDEYFQHDKFPSRLKESMIYSLEAGGKRLRPILLFASYEAYNNENIEPAISSAIALEMIHTYSLIHDDLPSMDNDDYRRGKLTNHRVYSEATAILAGDALLTYAFEIIAKDPLINNEQKARTIQLLANASGPSGMVGGQILDMEAEVEPVSLEQLEKIHALKTGQLLHFAISTGAFLGGASKEQIQELEKYAYYLGLIFQVQDDILDITGDENKMGKRTGSDEENEKSTYPKLLGMNGAKQKKEEYVNEAKEALVKANANEGYLMALTDYFSQRDH